MTRPTTHVCPGGCGAQVPRHQYACQADWKRLPAGLRRTISTAYNHGPFMAHVRAMDLAGAWFMRNPREQ